MSKNFTIDARLIINLGRDSIKDHTTALIELIKNSYDADATKVEVEIFCKNGKNQIRIADNGFGMTNDEINDNWLRIGYSEKRSSKNSEKGRRKTGEKGIGRIATDRLGAIVQLITKSKNDIAQGLKIDWDKFDVSKKRIEEIEIEELKNPKIKLPVINQRESATGTEILISKLRQKWTAENIEALSQELSIFTPPNFSISDFEVFLETDVIENYKKKIESAIFKVSEIELEAIYDGTSEEIIYTIKNKYFPKKIKTEIIKVNELITKDDSELKNSDKIKILCGPFHLKLMFFPRKSSLLEGTDFTLKQLREFLDQNAGIKIYRDNISVKPYGYPNSLMGDWLGLAERKAKDPAGISRETYKITPNQLVGSLYISRDENHNLLDSAAREGLVENEAFIQLKEIVLGSIYILESHRYELNKKLSQTKEEKKSTKDTVNHITLSLRNVRSDLENIKKNVTNYKESNLIRSINQVDEIIHQTEKTFEELLEEKRVLSGLATLGIASAVFGHETQSAIDVFKETSSNANGYLSLKNPNIEKAKENLSLAVKYAKLIAGWGSFALTRVQNEKRKIAPKKVNKIISDTINEIKPALDASNIELIKDLEKIYAKVFAIDIESIVLNLLTNAYNACLNSTQKKRVIKVELKLEKVNNQKGFNIKISDSGPGVAKEHLERIWDPLFSTKVGKSRAGGGTGLGLTIVKSLTEENNGFVHVDRDPDLKGARFTIWLPKVE